MERQAFEQYRDWAQAANRRADLLIDELREHQEEVAQEFKEAGKPPPDPRKVFEAWAIQKIAALQIMVWGENIDQPPDE